MTRQVSALVQVTSFHPGSFGGGVMLGRDPERPAGALVRARVPAHVLPRSPVQGETWRVTGHMERHPVFDPATGQEVVLDHVAAAWAAPLVPRGAALRRWIARNPAISGVGDGYAERLWDAYGPRLYDLIRAGDVEALARVLDLRKAVAIVDAFGLLLDEVSALESLDGMGLDGRTAHAAVRLFGPDAGRRFREDPYLLTLLEPWSKVDAAALTSGLLPDDPRRLVAAVDVAAAMAFRTTERALGGHTVVPRAALLARVRPMLGWKGAHLAAHAVELALRDGLLAEIGPGRYQARAPAHMEREVERSVAERLARPRAAVDQAVIAAAVAEVEAEDAIRLDPEQQEAVRVALGSGIAVLVGGAGTGKSTVVKAIVRAHQRAGTGSYAQMALSGRAAQRLREATGAPASTIYRYLRDVEHGKLRPGRGLVVVDEFSMLGTPDLWLLLGAVGVEADVLLVGDPGQLPPLTAGNPASAFSASRRMPRVELRRVHRQASATGIPQVAEAIREGRLPELPMFAPGRAAGPGVFLLPCDKEWVPARVMEVFETLAGPPPAAGDHAALARLHAADVQVLAMTKRGDTGAEGIGDAVEHGWLSGQPSIHDWGFRAGSKVLWTRNSYDHRTGRRDKDGRDEVVDLMNGMIGVVLRPTEAGAEVVFDDGTVSEVRKPDLGRMLRGWAVTVHKAQGSAFRSVIVPVVRSRLLDRAMLYTAVTRARVSAVLVGDPALIARAAETPPAAWRRLQALDLDGAAARRDAVVAEGQATPDPLPVRRGRG